MRFLKANIANLLTLTRAVFSPSMIYLSIYSHKRTYAIVFLLLFLSDFLDGQIARLLKIDSKFGRRFDAVADYIFYTSALLGFIKLFYLDISTTIIWFVLPLVFFFIPKIIGVVIFKKYPIVRMKSWALVSFVGFLWILISSFFGYNLFLLYLIAAFSFVGFLSEVYKYVVEHKFD